MHHLLDVLERVNAETPVAPLRWSIAHLNDASPESLARMKAMGVGWLMQNAFYFRGEAFLGQRGAEATRLSPPIGSALRMGAAGRRRHRRAPGDVVQPVRLAAMDAGRQDRRRHADARRPRKCRRATRRCASTRRAAPGSRSTTASRGSLAPGKLADLAVLSKDYLTVPIDEIGGIASLLTMVGGRVVYARGALCGAGGEGRRLNRRPMILHPRYPRAP